MFFVFTVSGFSGLIYESIWTHYLKLFLGHAAYAQTLVLAIFMGGMALGSWVCSKYSGRWSNLLIGYALAEALVGLLALGFHTVFDQSVRFSYAGVIPYLNAPFLVNAYKWGLSLLLILPQSVLLGMTFPLMSSGLIRLFPKNPGKTISLLYFTNSMGAAAGVLVSGFMLIRFAGLPWTIRIAGAINIALALAVWLLAKQRKPIQDNAEQTQSSPSRERSGYRLLLLVSLITGSASFIYEIGWIRMLNLVMGSSTHAFELMLSAFIFGLAFGGLWIHRRIDRIHHVERYLAHIQIVMGLLALSTLPLYGKTFNVMQWLVNTLGKTESGYTLFNIFSNAISLAIMLPTTFCAGMTLPLITYALIRKGYGERSIGTVYASNTVGAILGVFLAIHVGMPILGLKGLIIFGAVCDIALGVVLFWRGADYVSYQRPAVITAASVCVVMTAIFLVNLDPYKMASEVYRTGALMAPGDVEFTYYRDGKTATISTFMEKTTGVVSINTNGKTDASINMARNGDPSGDEPTMILAAVLPMAFNPHARTVANIGLGSGLTTHTLLGNPQLEQVDTVEIEKFMVEAAKSFRPRVERVYTDPRSVIYIEDAKTFFSLHNKKYDIIISEPSNPWVSGVSGLFSQEFYRLLNRYLTDEGIFVQWIQLYEMNNDIVISILKAISGNFSDFAAYAAHDRDMLIIAKKNGTLPALPTADVFKIPEIAAALEKVYIRDVQDIELRKMGSRRFLDGLLKISPVSANSDYYPYVDQNASRARFLQANAYDFHELTRSLLPVQEMLEGYAPPWSATDISLPSFYVKSQSMFTAMALRDYSLYGSFGPRYGNVPPDVQRKAVEFRRVFYDCTPGSNRINRQAALFNAAADMTPYLRPQELETVWKKMEAGPCAPLLSSTERDWIEMFRAAGRRDAAAMTREAQKILQGGQPMQPDEVKFLVAAGMIGSLMQGEKEGSLRLWSAYRPAMFGVREPDLLFRLLVADSSK